MKAFLSPVVFGLTLIAALSGASAGAETPDFSNAQRGAIEKIVREYLIANPEVLVEALTEYRSRQELAQAESRKKAAVQFSEKLNRDPNSPIGGNPSGDVTLVEFFDYQCGYCKAVFGDLQKLFRDDPKLRFVYKELPILSPASTYAAKAALASREQGKYIAFHNALMGHRGQLSEDLVHRIAASIGLDVDRLKKDMEDPRIAAALAANHELADGLDVRGTPGFVVGEQVVPGAVDLEALKRLISDQRKKS